jgi:hypothetical protein
MVMETIVSRLSRDAEHHKDRRMKRTYSEYEAQAEEALYSDRQLDNYSDDAIIRNAKRIKVDLDDDDLLKPNGGEGDDPSDREEQSSAEEVARRSPSTSDSLEDAPPDVSILRPGAAPAALAGGRNYVPSRAHELEAAAQLGARCPACILMKVTSGQFLRQCQIMWAVLESEGKGGIPQIARAANFLLSYYNLAVAKVYPNLFRPMTYVEMYNHIDSCLVLPKFEFASDAQLMKKMSTIAAHNNGQDIDFASMKMLMMTIQQKQLMMRDPILNAPILLKGDPRRMPDAEAAAAIQASRSEYDLALEELKPSGKSSRQKARKAKAIK